MEVRAKLRGCENRDRGGYSQESSHFVFRRIKSMKRTAQQLADYVGGNLRGNASAVLDSVASLKNAGPNDLSYAEEKFAAEVERSRAGCIIVQSGDWPLQTVIIARNPKLAFARAAGWLLAEPDND